MRASARLAAGGVLALAAGAVFAQVPQGQMVTGSIRGTLVMVDKALSGLVIRDETGAQKAWRLDRSVIEQVAKVELGQPLWMIYREFRGGNRAVTAVGFPGKETKPVYFNGTGVTVLLRTGPYVDASANADPFRACRGVREDKGQIAQYRLRRGMTTEDEGRCWCCAPADGTCEPANRSYEPGEKVTGRIILARCFDTGN